MANSRLHLDTVRVRVCIITTMFHVPVSYLTRHSSDHPPLPDADPDHTNRTTLTTGEI